MPNVTIYSTTSCAACHTLTNWLESKGIPYEKKVIDENENFMQEFMAQNEGMIGVPFTVIQDENGVVSKITGFEPKKFIEALSLT